MKIKTETEIEREKTIADVFDSIDKGLKKEIFPLIGQAFVTHNRVPIPRVIFFKLNYDQKKAVRAILDRASFGV